MFQLTPGTGFQGRALPVPAPLGGLAYSAAAKMTVLGLDRIKERFGLRWNKVSETVHAFFEASLERRMRPCDVFYRAGELDYVIIFRDLALDNAQRHCIAIAEEVCRRLFGEEEVSLAVRAVVGMAENRLLLAEVSPSALVTEILAKSGIETIVSSQNGTGAPGKGLAPGEACKSVTARELHLTFGPAGGRPHMLTDAQLEFVYRPIWDSQRNAVLTYLCQPTPRGSPVQGLCLAPFHLDDRLVIDVITLKECARRVTQLQRAGVRLLVGCPVHFSTLAVQRPWSAYSRLLRALPQDIAKYLAFFLVGIEPGIPNTRLCEAIPKLSLHSKFVFAVLDPRDRQIERFARTGVTAMGLELRNSGNSDRPLIEQVESFAKRADNCGMDSFILGAERTSTAVNAIAAGVRFVEGNAILPPLPEPVHGLRHELMDLYRVAMV
jgi:hypothetical protein